MKSSRSPYQNSPYKQMKFCISLQKYIYVPTVHPEVFKIYKIESNKVEVSDTNPKVSVECWYPRRNQYGTSTSEKYPCFIAGDNMRRRKVYIFGVLCAGGMQRPLFIYQTTTPPSSPFGTVVYAAQHIWNLLGDVYISQWVLLHSFLLYKRKRKEGIWKAALMCNLASLVGSK